MRAPNGALKWTTSTSAAASAYTDTGDISNATLYSSPFWLAHLEAYALQLVTSGATVTGTFKLRGSNSNPNVPEAGFPSVDAFDWTDIDGSSIAVTVAGSVLWNASGVGYRWVQVVWTESGAAAGSVRGQANGKGSI